MFGTAGGKLGFPNMENGFGWLVERRELIQIEIGCQTGANSLILIHQSSGGGFDISIAVPEGHVEELNFNGKL